MTVPKWIIVIVSLVLGMGIEYATYKTAFMEGKIIGETPFVLFQDKFYRASQKKQPLVFEVYGDKWQLFFHTHEKDVLVQKTPKMKIKKPIHLGPR